MSTMSSLLSIDEPVRAARPRPQWRAFTEMGFRPLYLAGSAWALISVLLWVHAPSLLRGELNGWRHAHEMLWGFVATIAVGFLLTAGANWTGRNPLRGNALAALCRYGWRARYGSRPSGLPAGGHRRPVFFLWARRRWGARSG